jgi:hypothetical protein
MITTWHPTHYQKMDGSYTSTPVACADEVFFIYIYSNSITKEPFNNLIITKKKKTPQNKRCRKIFTLKANASFNL